MKKSKLPKWSVTGLYQESEFGAGQELYLLMLQAETAPSFVTSILPRRIRIKTNKCQQKCFYCFPSLFLMKTVPLKQSNILPYDFCSHNAAREKTWKQNWLLLIFLSSREETCQWEREQKSFRENLDFKLPLMINSNHTNIYFCFYGLSVFRLAADL